MDYSEAGPRGMGEADTDPEAAKLQASFARLSNQTREMILQAGHEALLMDLVARVGAGVASHQEKAILRNLLRDNGMTLGVPPPGTGPQSGPAPDLPDLPAYNND